MQDTTKNVLIFLVGAFFGAVSSVVAVKKKYEEKADEEIEQMRRWYDRKLKENGIGAEEKAEEEKPIDISKEYQSGHKTESAPEVPEASFVRHIKTVPKKDPVDYTAYYHPEDPAEAESPREEDDDPGPKVISQKEYGADGRYSKITLLYYIYDGVLTLSDDQTEEMIKDLDEVEGMIGSVLEDSDFVDDDSQEFLYIKNERRSCYYEIKKVFEKYLE